MTETDTTVPMTLDEKAAEVRAAADPDPDDLPGHHHADFAAEEVPW